MTFGKSGTARRARSRSALVLNRQPFLRLSFASVFTFRVEFANEPIHDKKCAWRARNIANTNNRVYSSMMKFALHICVLGLRQSPSCPPTCKLPLHLADRPRYATKFWQNAPQHLTAHPAGQLSCPNSLEFHQRSAAGVASLWSENLYKYVGIEAGELAGPAKAAAFVRIVCASSNQERPLTAVANR